MSEHIIKITLEYKKGSRRVAELIASGLSQEYSCIVVVKEGGK